MLPMTKLRELRAQRTLRQVLFKELKWLVAFIYTEKKHLQRLIFSTLNFNSIPKKSDYTRITFPDFVDLLSITESKLDQSFLDSQFLSIGSPSPLGKTKTDMMVDLWCILRKTFHRNNYLSIYPPSQSDEYFFFHLGTFLDNFSPKCDRFVLLGDFNVQENKTILWIFKCIQYKKV